MTKFFGNSEAATFHGLGWDVCGDSAYFHSEALQLGINICANGELSIQSAADSGRWKWVHQSAHETALLAICAASDWFYAKTGWELLSRRP